MNVISSSPFSEFATRAKNLNNNNNHKKYSRPRPVKPPVTAAQTPLPLNRLSSGHAPVTELPLNCLSSGNAPTTQPPLNRLSSGNAPGTHPPLNRLSSGNTGATHPPLNRLSSGNTGATHPPLNRLSSGNTGATHPPLNRLSSGNSGATHLPLKRLSSGNAAFKSLVLKQQQQRKQSQENNLLQREDDKDPYTTKNTTTNGDATKIRDSANLSNPAKDNDPAKMAKVVTTARGTHKATQKLLAGKNIRQKLKGQIRKIAQERLTMRQVFKRYVESSTLHGFRYVCADTYFIRRFIWAILMILGAIYFIVKLRHGIEEYFGFPFSTLSTVKYVEVLQFPAISFCSVNQFKATVLKHSKLYPLFKNNRLPLLRNWSDPGIDLSGEELVEAMRKVSFGVDDLFMSCEYISADSAHPMKSIRKCNKQNFTSYFSDTGQLCFTLNSGKPGYDMMEITMEGLNNAFEVLFDLKNFESIMENAYSGMQVIVHDQIDPPIFKSGFFLPAGTKTFAKLSKTETENLPPPYRTQCGEIELKYYETYNQNACLLEKLTDYVSKKCGCREFYMPDNGMPYCSLRKTILCAFPAKETFDKFSFRTKCPIECEKVTFSASLSSTPFIQDARIGIEPRLIQQKIIFKNDSHHLPLMKMHQTMSPQELEKYIEENIVVGVFFFGDMSKKVEVQEATFDFYQFLGDMGGEIGLMLGASLLTFFEFIDLFGFLGYHQLLRLYKEKKEKYRHSMMIKRQSLLFSRDSLK